MHRELLINLLQGGKSPNLNILDLMSGWGRSSQVLFKWFGTNMHGRKKLGGNLHLIDFTPQMGRVSNFTKFEGNPKIKR